MDRDDIESKQEANSLLWLVYLFFMPSTFFRRFVLKPAPALTLLYAWVYGTAGAVERIDSNVAQGRTDFYGLDWTSYWISSVAFGAAGGLIFCLRIRILGLGQANSSDFLTSVR